MTDPTTELPLAGTVVLDLTVTLSGPYCTYLLGVLGAEVIKVERPGTGDDARRAGPPFWGGEAATFLASGANKRSLVLDLKTPEGRDVMLRLAARSDVFVQNMRPGVAGRLGLSFEDLTAVSPALVYCSMGAFGSRGPLRERAGYDPLMQASAGIMSTTGEPGQRPVRTGPSIVDLGTGMWATIGVLAALALRARTGEAQFVETSLFETAVNWQPAQIIGYLASGLVPPPLGRSQTILVPFESFKTADGELVVAAGNDGLFRRLCEAMGLPGLADDLRFRSNPDRVVHRLELSAILAERMLEDTTGRWRAKMDVAGVPAAPVQNIGQLVDDPQFQAMDLLQSLPHPDIPDLRLVAPPLSLNRERLPLRTPPPLLGQHTHELLESLGFTTTDIAGLRTKGVLG
jgi:crotonobetainyl-CoA:carnitine CoA-transferase CaiB-like acyl-CoA transferase